MTASRAPSPVDLLQGTLDLLILRSLVFGPAHGHAIEARLYAEDPVNDWRPSTGVLHRFAIPAPLAGSRRVPAARPIQHVTGPGPLPFGSGPGPRAVY